MPDKSGTRILAENLEIYAREFRLHIKENSSPEQKAYNAMCDVLDHLNTKLTQETEGKINVTWERFQSV